MFASATPFSATAENCPHGWKPALDYFDECVDTVGKKIGWCLFLAEALIWIFAFVPQMYTNYRIKRCGGFTGGFLACWIFGDILYLIALYLTEEVKGLFAIAILYIVMDVTLISQYGWYNRHGLFGRPAAANYLRPANGNVIPNANNGAVLYALFGGMMFLQGPSKGEQPLQLSNAITWHIIGNIIGFFGSLFCIAGRYVQYKTNRDKQNVDHLSKGFFIVSFIANLLHFASVLFFIEFDNLFGYFERHLTSLLLVPCIILDVLIIRQINTYVAIVYSSLEDEIRDDV